MTLEEKYSNKILGVRNYKSDQDEFFVKDFIDLDLLEPILDEFITSESDITPAGEVFLAEYYNIKKLSVQLFERNRLNEIYPKCGSALEIENIINDFEPMLAISFIEQSKGNISKDSVINERLLPPK